MAWNSPANLSLAALGTLSDGNGAGTPETSLNECGRSSGTGQTAMWASFRPGGTVISIVTNGSGGSVSADVGMDVDGDVADYMGGDLSNTSGQLSNVSTSNTVVWEDVGDNDTGSLYQTRICNQNASDYTGTLSERHGGSTLDGFGITQDTTNKDKFSASVGGGI